MIAFLLNPAHFRWLDRLPAPRMPRIRKRGQHHADAIRIDLFTATVPVKQTPDRPPWDRETAANPVLTDDLLPTIPQMRAEYFGGNYGVRPQLEAAKLPQVIA